MRVFFLHTTYKLNNKKRFLIRSKGKRGQWEGRGGGRRGGERGEGKRN